MQPDQPLPQPAGQFDFILQGQQKPKPSLIGGNDKTRRLIVILVGAGVLVLVLLIFFLVFGRKTSSTKEVVAVMAKQQEIIRITADAQQNSKDTNIKAIAETTSVVLEADQAGLKGYILKTTKKKVTAKDLSVSHSKKTDDILAAAQESGHYDSEFAALLTSNLKAYQQDLDKAYKVSGKNGQALLKSAYSSVDTILGSSTLATSPASSTVQ